MCVCTPCREHAKVIERKALWEQVGTIILPLNSSRRKEISFAHICRYGKVTILHSQKRQHLVHFVALILHSINTFSVCQKRQAAAARVLAEYSPLAAVTLSLLSNQSIYFTHLQRIFFHCANTCNECLQHCTIALASFCVIGRTSPSGGKKNCLAKQQSNYYTNPFYESLCTMHIVRSA